jgi:uncharacterized membrane protein
MSSTPEKQPITGWQRSVVVGIDRFVYWLSKHWLAVFNTIAALYVGLPILAPVLMQAGLNGPARVIYTIYSPMCHQMAQRSFFLFGEQPAYPRELAGTELRPIEAYVDELPEYEGITINNWATFFSASRSFLGNDQMGYKMALCQRDIGIYLFVLVGGLIYAMLRNRIKVKPLPILIFIIVGMGPIALDGVSQLLSYWVTPLDGSTAGGIMGTLQKIFPLRESSPLLRSMTGAWFGLMLVWLAYPHVNEGMKDTERNLGEKLRRVGAIQD